MKKIVIVVISIAILLAAAFLSTNAADTKTEYLRIHIRANSNNSSDQLIKYQIKDEIVEYLIPYLANVSTKEQAKAVVGSKLSELSKVATNALRRNGYTYSANAKLTQEDFPVRQYNDLVLESGVYDALIIELGEAKGDNWWCVVYPPLCFVGGENNGSNSIKYKSKLLEIIESWKKGK